MATPHGITSHRCIWFSSIPQIHCIHVKNDAFFDAQYMEVLHFGHVVLLYKLIIGHSTKAVSEHHGTTRSRFRGA